MLATSCSWHNQQAPHPPMFLPNQARPAMLSCTRCVGAGVGVPRALQLAQPLAASLAQLHSQGVTLGRLWPDAVRLDECSVPVVADFRWAQPRGCGRKDVGDLLGAFYV